MVLTPAEKSARYRAKDIEAYREQKNALVKLPHHREARRLYAKKWRDAHKKAPKPRVRRFTDEQIAEHKRIASLRYRAEHREELRIKSNVAYHKYKHRYKHLSRDYQLRKKYGISWEDKERMFEAQGSKCAICQSETSRSIARFHVDHCHVTGKVRGVLCHVCNTKLGWYETFKLKIESYLNGQKGSA